MSASSDRSSGGSCNGGCGFGEANTDSGHGSLAENAANGGGDMGSGASLALLVTRYRCSCDRVPIKKQPHITEIKYDTTAGT